MCLIDSLLVTIHSSVDVDMRIWQLSPHINIFTCHSFLFILFSFQISHWMLVVYSSSTSFFLFVSVPWFCFWNRICQLVCFRSVAIFVCVFANVSQSLFQSVANTLRSIYILLIFILFKSDMQYQLASFTLHFLFHFPSFRPITPVSSLCYAWNLCIKFISNVSYSEGLTIDDNHDIILNCYCIFWIFRMRIIVILNGCVLSAINGFPKYKEKKKRIQSQLTMWQWYPVKKRKLTIYTQIESLNLCPVSNHSSTQYALNRLV